MEYKMTNPCDQCPFLNKMSHGFDIDRLREFASGPFPCHKTADNDEETGDYHATETSQHCAGALIFNEKRGEQTNLMRTMEWLEVYNPSKLNMKADVR